MACNLTAAIGINCKDQIGGLKYIYVCNDYYQNIEEQDIVTPNTFDITTAGFASWVGSDGATATGTVNLYRYALRPNLSSMTINTNADPNNGTTFYTQTLSITLQKLATATAYQLRLLAYNRPQIFVEDNNTTGTAKGDLAGFTFEISAEEKAPYYEIPAGTPGATDYPFDGLADLDASLVVNIA